METPRIAILMRSLPLGGAQRVMTTLANEMIRSGVRVDFVLGRARGALLSELSSHVRIVELGRAPFMPALPKLLQIGAITWAEAAALAPTRLPTVVRHLSHVSAYFDREKPDAVLTTLPANILAALWARECSRYKPRIVIREANTLTLESEASGSPFARLVPALARRWYPKANAIIAVSKGAGRDLAESTQMAEDRIVAVHNPVDTERIGALAQAALDPHDEAWIADSSDPLLINIGRLHPQKDQAKLIEAASKVLNQRPCRLLILGDGVLHSKLVALGSSLGLGDRLRLPGSRPNPYPYLARAQVFVLSSAWEGFPNVLLEALACGCQIVSTDCPNGPAELLANGRFGRLVPVGDVDALAGAITETLDAPLCTSDSLVERARAYSPQRLARTYLTHLLGDTMVSATRSPELVAASAKS